MAEQRINLNTATAEELTELPRIGPALAQRIATYRETVRPFEEPSQITAVSGIGDTTYRALADRLVVAASEQPSGPEGAASHEGVEGMEDMPPEPATEEKAPEEPKVSSEEEIAAEEPAEPLPQPYVGRVSIPAGAAGVEPSLPPDAARGAGVSEVEGLLSGEPILEEASIPVEEAAAEPILPPTEEAQGLEETMEEAPPERSDALAEITEEAPSEAEEMLPEAEAPPEAEEEASPEVAESPAEEQPEWEAVAPESQLPPARAEERPVPAPSRSWWRRLSWLWTALLGGLLGMAFTLVVLAGVNGSLDVAHSRAVVDLTGQMDGLATDINALEGDVAGLRSRLDALEELTVRMDRIEAAAGDLQEATADLDQRADVLEESIASALQELESVSEQVVTLQDQAEQTQGFFQGLQRLLNDVFGALEGESTETPTPTPEGG